jgi:hypothetical protein
MNHRCVRNVLGSAFLWLALCAVIVPGPDVAAQSIDGIWKTRGYGMIIEINGPMFKSFEVTATTCVPGITARRNQEKIFGREATYTTAEGQVFFVRSSVNLRHKTMHKEGSASDIGIDRISKLPAVCEHPTLNTPEGVFEVFSRTFAENYILFDQKKIDWGEITRSNAKRIGPETKAAELFDLLSGMIEPLHDRHTAIVAPDLKRQFTSFRPGTDWLIKGDLRSFRSNVVPALWQVTDYYLKTSLRKFCNGQVEYGELDDKIGYMRIRSFSEFSKNDSFAAGLSALEAALDEIFSDSKLNALVIDVRINFGGEDPLGLAIASRLATRSYVAYTKVARADPLNRNKWTRGERSIVRPSTRPSFHGPVVELTGPLTISAGETFTQALMGRTPRVIRIGENTQGVFSDILSRRLPNGWRFGLPNEVFRTAKGTTFDGAGIPPDIDIPVFANADIAKRVDPALLKAIEILEIGLRPTFQPR